MTDLRERINAATTAAMRARDKGKERLAALRLVQAELKQVEVDERRTLSDADVIAVLNRMVKRRNDSESQFRQAGRTDLADKEAFEIALIEEFLPAPLSESELDRLIADAIASIGATGPRDMGKVIAALRGPLAGRADMAAVSNRVKSRLG
jgi:hypothetical protein